MKYTMKYLAYCMIATVALFSSCSELSKDESILANTSSELISDFEGNTYKTVNIGEQTWMAENLKVTHFQNGDPILHVTDNYEWFEAGRDRIPARRYYNDDPSTAEKYGILYNGFAVSDPRGLAPAGWRVPGDTEWEKLFKALGGNMIEDSRVQLKGDSEFAQKFNNRILFYGWTFASKDFSDFLEQENDGILSIIEASGFNPVAAGQIDMYGNFYDLDRLTKFWSYPTEKFSFSFPDGSGSEHASITMRSNPRAARHTRGSAASGKSVRLVKEQVY